MSTAHTYHDASSASLGIMTCAACRKPIESGQFRCRETRDGYINHHRACLPNDPKWAELDAQADAHRARYAAFQAACAEFRERWKGFDLYEVPEGGVE